MRIEKTARPSRLLRAREFTDQVTTKPAEKTSKSGKSRFVAPYFLADSEQTRILQLLEQAGLGDAEGRQLFLTAAEYEVGSRRPGLQQEQAEGAKPAIPVKSRLDLRIEKELGCLGVPAKELLTQLRSSHKDSRSRLCENLSATDSFQRIHDERYLVRLELELEHLLNACEQSMEAKVPAEAPAPLVGKQAKVLVLQLARIFEECLEVGLQAPALAVFADICGIIAEDAAIDIPREPGILAEILTDSAA